MAIRAAGKVTRLYVHSRGTTIRLEVPPELRPANGYFTVELAHPNYHAVYSLALSAAVNGHRLSIRTTADITPANEATVSYVVVDW